MAERARVFGGHAVSHLVADGSSFSCLGHRCGRGRYACFGRVRLNCATRRSRDGRTRGFCFWLAQITLGAWVIWSNKAADIATAHVAVGATMLALGIAISAISLRLSQSFSGDMRPGRAISFPGTCACQMKSAADSFG